VSHYYLKIIAEMLHFIFCFSLKCCIFAPSNYQKFYIMHFGLFINFAGNCEQAVNFYADVFKSEVKNMMFYRDAPEDPKHVIPVEYKDNVCYAEVVIGKLTVMFCDWVSTDGKLIVGNNISPTIAVETADEVRRIFDRLKDGGTVQMELQQAFFSELYGYVTDKFGIAWQVLVHNPEA
jgi:PhnB protein